MKNIIISSKRNTFSSLITLFFIVTSVLYLASCGGGDAQTFTLTVMMNGTGSGRVASSSEGIFCEKDCSEEYDNGTQVTLSATPYTGSNFTGWSGGGCSGTEPCTLTINNITSVTATFTLNGTDLTGLITPYVNESDMSDVMESFSTVNSSPWGFVHDGIDIFPQGDLKPFQAVCSGRVFRIFVFSEQVTVVIACNSAYLAGYHFETQSPDTGQDQLDNIMVVEGQEVSQGNIIGYLYAPNENAHVHFSLYKNTIPICPEAYFSLENRNSILNLIHVTFPGANMCYGGDATPHQLVTPYVNEADMKEIDAGFSSVNSVSPWEFVNDGLDIFPQENLKPFQAVCPGTVDTVQLRQTDGALNWQVEVLTWMR